MIRFGQIQSDTDFSLGGHKATNVQSIIFAGGGEMTGVPGAGSITPATSSALGGVIINGFGLALDGSGNGLVRVLTGAGLTIDGTGAVGVRLAVGGGLGVNGSGELFSAGGGSGGTLASTDQLPEGATNLYATPAHVVAGLVGQNLAANSLTIDTGNPNAIVFELKINGASQFSVTGGGVLTTVGTVNASTGSFGNLGVLGTGNFGALNVGGQPVATQSQLSGFATTSQLNNYLPLAGGTLQGSLAIGNGGGLSAGSITSNGIMSVTGGANLVGSGGTISGFSTLSVGTISSNVLFSASPLFGSGTVLLSGDIQNDFTTNAYTFSFQGNDGNPARLRARSLVFPANGRGLGSFTDGAVQGIGASDTVTSSTSLTNFFANHYYALNGLTVTQADLAELVLCPNNDAPGTADANKLGPADVAIIDPTDDEAVTKHTGTQYDPTVAGVVSTRPGMTLGYTSFYHAGEDGIYYTPEGAPAVDAEGHPYTTDTLPAPPATAPMALAGRVPTKVTTTYVKPDGTIVHRPIRKGYLLVSSSIPGHAMAADPSDFGSAIPFGTLLGKAMQDFNPADGEPTEGVIKVWVNLG